MIVVLYLEFDGLSNTQACVLLEKQDVVKTTVVIIVIILDELIQHVRCDLAPDCFRMRSRFVCKAAAYGNEIVICCQLLIGLRDPEVFCLLKVKDGLAIAVSGGTAVSECLESPNELDE